MVWGSLNDAQPLSSVTRLLARCDRTRSISALTMGWQELHKLASVDDLAAAANSAVPGAATRQVPRLRMASRRALLGIVPVLTATPPMVAYPSTTQTFLPSLAAWMAAF